MQDADWAKIYAAMDKRLDLKYEQLPAGEQVGKRTPPPLAAKKKSSRRVGMRTPAHDPERCCYDHHQGRRPLACSYSSSAPPG